MADWTISHQHGAKYHRAPRNAVHEHHAMRGVGLQIAGSMTPGVPCLLDPK